MLALARCTLGCAASGNPHSETAKVTLTAKSARREREDADEAKEVFLLPPLYTLSPTPYPIPTLCTLCACSLHPLSPPCILSVLPPLSSSSLHVLAPCTRFLISAPSPCSPHPFPLPYTLSPALYPFHLTPYPLPPNP
jgi:hypothetical protein